MSGKITYRQQYTRCGKERCRKCKEGAGHGPYWYAYWSENGRTISKYIGIHPPPDLERDAQNAAYMQVKKVVSSKDTFEAPNLAKRSLSQKGLSGSEAVEEGRKNLEQVTLETASAQPHLRIYLLGHFRVERLERDEWQTVANRTWQRRRARALLGCLLSQTGRRMGREQVMQALWPDLAVEIAANRLNGAVHELRQILEPGLARPAASKMLRLERDILTLADATQIWVDAEAFEGLINRANATKDPRLVEQMLEEAAALYEGDYLLEELYSEWAGPRRDSLRRSWMGLLLELAELRAAHGALTSAIEPLDHLLTTDPIPEEQAVRRALTSAIEPLNRLLTADPIHETAVRRLMVLLTQLDRRGEAIHAYKRLASILKRDYESEPLPETVELYKALRQGQIQATSPTTAPLPTATPVQTERSQATRNQPLAQELHHVSTPKEDATVSLTLPHNAPRPTLALGRQNMSPLIGRERELETMTQILLAIDTPSSRSVEKGSQKTGERDHPHSTSQAHFVMLMGEIGIGKTRLAEELSHKAQAHGWLVASTRAYEQEGTIPYRPWTDILRTLLLEIPLDKLINILEGKSSENVGTRILTPTTHAKLTRLASLLPELATYQELSLPQNRLQAATVPEQERFHLWEAVLSLLSSLSQPTPLLIILDDLHWTDDSSLELLAYLARHCQNAHIMLLATCRDIELAPCASLRSLLNDLRREQVLITLPLQPLTPVQIGRLISHLPHEQVLSIQNLAGGNPLFAEELARFSEPAASESMTTDDKHHRPRSPNELVTGMKRSTPLPETIAAVLERRMNRLSGDCQSLLSKAAVLGRSFEFSLLMRITGDAKIDEDTALDLLEEALRSGLISEQVNGARITYHFWHPLIVSHLYECLSATRRTQLHRRAAQALIESHAGNEEEVAVAIVYHLDKYGQDKQQLAHYATIVGNQAISLSAYSQALYHYQLALQALQSLQDEESNSVHIAELLECIAECNVRQSNLENRASTGCEPR
jgi:DNA-binding SARP family transcriptional activator